MSKAIAALVRLGLESQENRKREFFKRLKANLTNNDPKQQDRLVDEFRTLILGR
jgi:Mg2+/Co2+ transporter CorC